MFAILQKYDFSSKSQQIALPFLKSLGCLRYCKSTIFQANHNGNWRGLHLGTVVCDTAKVRFFKQITTSVQGGRNLRGCLRYCKSTIFQANHNACSLLTISFPFVCDTAKVRFFKQITTEIAIPFLKMVLFAILQKYDFSSKSQQMVSKPFEILRCLRYCKSTIFQANHNLTLILCPFSRLFAILQKYDFSSKSQHRATEDDEPICCLRYCKSTIFQANHNKGLAVFSMRLVVCDTAKVRFFKQITT